MTGQLFVVSGNQRSGTTVLRQLITSCGVADLGEITQYDPENEFRFYEYVRRRMQDDPRYLHPYTHKPLFREYLAWVKSRVEGPALIDLKYNAMRFLDFGTLSEKPVSLHFLRQSGAKFIHIVRLNKLRLIVSLELALKTNRWGVWEGEERGELPKISLDPRSTLALIEEQERWSKDFARYLPEAPVVEYEHMFTETGDFTPRTLEIVERFLGRKVPSNYRDHIKLQKQTPDRLADLIENYGELAASVSNSRYSWMLAD